MIRNARKKFKRCSAAWNFSPALFKKIHTRFQTQSKTSLSRPQPQYWSRAAKRGGSKRGGFPIWTCPSFFVLFCPSWDFPDFSGILPICSGMVRGFSRFVLFLFLALLRAPTRNSPFPKGSATQSGPFPKEVGNPPVLETPRFSFSQEIKNGHLNVRGRVAAITL